VEKDIDMKGQTPVDPPRKMTYTSPRLVKYGQVGTLTQGGSANGAEGTDSKTGLPDMKTMIASDRAIKTNIVKVGVHPSGVGLYLFRYNAEFREKCGHGLQFGVMADEVEAVLPDAVALYPDGYKRVNYALLGIDRPEHSMH